jgi:hypothetical protein
LQCWPFEVTRLISSVNSFKVKGEGSSNPGEGSPTDHAHHRRSIFPFCPPYLMECCNEMSARSHPVLSKACIMPVPMLNGVFQIILKSGRLHLLQSVMGGRRAGTSRQGSPQKGGMMHSSSLFSAGYASHTKMVEARALFASCRPMWHTATNI